jgi:hypothetical protein
MDFKDVQELIDTISAPALIMIGNFYGRVGALLKGGLADVGPVHDILIVTPLWEKMKPYVIYCRQKYDIHSFEWLEYLYNEVKKREQRQ